MIYLRPDPHAILNDALSRCTFNGKKPVIVSSRLSRWHSNSYSIRVLIAGLSMLIIVLDLWRSVLRGNVVVIREFWNIPLVFSLPILWPLRNLIIFNINHNLSDLPEHFPVSILIMAKFGFSFFLFDGAAASKYIPLNLQGQFSYPLFPCVSIPRLKSLCVQPILSVVGNFRNEKGNIEEIKSVLIDLASDSRWILRIGTPVSQASIFNTLGSVEVIDTSEHSDYIEFLTTSDIVLIFADPKKYYIRHSGTIMDAIACGAIPIVPEFPVFSSQVNIPTIVGETYQINDEIKYLILEVITRLSHFKNNQVLYFKDRKLIELKKAIVND